MAPTVGSAGTNSCPSSQNAQISLGSHLPESGQKLAYLWSIRPWYPSATQHGTDDRSGDEEVFLAFTFSAFHHFEFCFGRRFSFFPANRGSDPRVLPAVSNLVQHLSCRLSETE